MLTKLNKIRAVAYISSIVPNSDGNWGQGVPDIVRVSVYRYTFWGVLFETQHQNVQFYSNKINSFSFSFENSWVLPCNEIPNWTGRDFAGYLVLVSFNRNIR